MSENIEFIPLAAESLGVRSMCTYVQTPDVKILIDPGVSLGPRFGLLPHPREYLCLKECREKIARFANEADIITISHYHFDHNTPTYTDYVWNFSDPKVAHQIYSKKTIIAKDFRSKINPSQRRRGWIFKKAIADYAKEIITADGKTFFFGNTSLRFSQPVSHGEDNTPLGWIIMLTIERGDLRFVHTSDIQGPISDKTLQLLIAMHPTLVYLGGPPLYLLDYRYTKASLEHALKNTEKLVEEVSTVILDHHLLRAEGWRKTAKAVFETAKTAGHMVFTAAEYIEKTENSLESIRKTLYQNEPPFKAFNEWTKLSIVKRKHEMPPI